MTNSPDGERRLPRVAELAVTSMALVIVAGIYLAAYLPRQGPLLLPTALVAVSAALLLANAFILLRLRDFAWDRFFLVAGWAWLAYLLIAGMLEFVFLIDQTRGALLTLMTVILLIFSVDIPILLGFSVARYQGTGNSQPV